MKKMWKKNNKAVSPVIATILMVAITVVLAAVLYVMVMGFGGDGGGQAPTASLTNSGNRLVLSISQPTTMGSTSSITVIIGSANTTKEVISTTTTYGTGLGIKFVDAGSDGKISTGDYFTRASGTATLIKIVWTSGGTSQVIAEGTI